MARRAFILLSTVSLVICVAAVMLWVRSHAVADTISWTTEDDGEGRYVCVERALFSYTGGIGVTRSGTEVTGPEAQLKASRLRQARIFPVGLDWATTDPPFQPPGSGEGTFLGFQWKRQANDQAVGGLRLRPSLSQLAVPYWAVFLATACGAWPVTSLIVRAARSRWGPRAPGRCPTCGYDLRATSDRCPECGAVPTAAGKP